MNVNKFVDTHPSNQNAIECFPALWYSKFPDEYKVQSGDCLAFEDGRLKWALDNFDIENNWDVLELGPLEGAHPFYLERNTPVKSITSIEGNRQCWLKCLITKEITDLKRTRFLLGNFEEYLKHCEEQFDLGLAIGVLYHMKNPLELISLISSCCERIIIWTQLAGKKQEEDWKTTSLSYENLEVQGYICDYGSVPEKDEFIGGVGKYSVWLKKDCLIKSLEHFGFKKITWGDQGTNQFGHQATLIAQKA